MNRLPATSQRNDPCERRISLSECCLRPIHENDKKDDEKITKLNHHIGNIEICSHWNVSLHNTIITLEDDDECNDNDDCQSLFGMSLSEFISDLEEELDVIHDGHAILSLDCHNNKNNQNVIELDGFPYDDDEIMSYASGMLSIQSDVYDDDVFEQDDDFVTKHEYDVNNDQEVQRIVVCIATERERNEVEDDDLNVLRNQLWKQSLKKSMFKPSSSCTTSSVPRPKPLSVQSSIK
jgi:hypothetical protein